MRITYDPEVDAMSIVFRETTVAGPRRHSQTYYFVPFVVRKSSPAPFTGLARAAA